MAVNRENYGIYIIDYFDGKLDPVESAEFFCFLSQNPDLEEEFNSFKNIELPVNAPKYNKINDLRKDFKDFERITDKNFEEFCIAFSEADLDKFSRQKLIKYLEKNPEKNKEFELYRKIKLHPDISAVYPDKLKLKKHKTIVLRIVGPLIYAAAAIILVIVLTNIFRQENPSELSTTAEIYREKDESSKETPDNESSDKSIVLKRIIEESVMRPAEPVSEEPSIHITDKTEIRGSSESLNLALTPIIIKRIDYLRNPSAVVPGRKELPQKQVTDPVTPEDRSFRASIRERVASFEMATNAENLNIWTLAEASVKGINYLTESDVRIARKVNDEGKLSGIAIESETFGFSTPIKR